MIEFEQDGIPSAELKLKVGDIAIITGAVSGLTDLCNNSRVIIEKIHPSKRLLTVRKMNDPRGVLYDLPRRWYRSIMVNGMTVSRLQFPVELAYAITIHKSQGQTLKKVVFDATKPVFAHGQTYVALSRVKRRNNIRFFKDDSKHLAQPVILNSVIFRSFLDSGNQGPPQPVRKRKRVDVAQAQRNRRRAAPYVRT